MEDALRALHKRQRPTYESNVLILVLMEDALRDFRSIANQYVIRVLILVLMEDALRGPTIIQPTAPKPTVLILVLMEDALRAFFLMHNVDESNMS